MGGASRSWRWLAAAGTGLALLAMSACPREPTLGPPEPPPSLIDSATATVEQLCAEPPRGWGVLDDQGVITAETLGVCLGRIEHPDDGALWQFAAQYWVRGHDRPSWELHTWLDHDGRPRYAEFRTPLVVTHFRWVEGQLVVRRLGDTLLVEGAGDVWVTPDHGLHVRELMLRLGVGRSGDGHEGLIQRGFAPERDQLGEVELTLMWAADPMPGAGLPDRARARVGDTGLAFELDGASAGLAGLRIQALGQPDAPRYWAQTEAALGPPLPAPPMPRYQLPAGLQVSPVEIASEPGEPLLAAELVELAGDPALADGPPARRPGVLFIGGAGPQDRHGFVPGSAVDIGSHEIQDALAEAGFAVLRFDDRGVAGSTLGDDPTPGFLALVDDARRAMSALAAQPGVDPKALTLIGHGEGALVASILAGEQVRVRGRKHSIAALVLLAGPGRNLRELVYDEIRASMLGRREGEIRTTVDRAKRVHDAALADEDLPASSEGARQWMIEAFAEDPLARLARVRAPILAVQGGKDFQVSPERDFGPLRELVETRAGPGSQALLVPGLDYLLKPEPGLSTPGHYADLRRHVDTELIAAIVAWLRQVLAA